MRLIATRRTALLALLAAASLSCATGGQVASTPELLGRPAPDFTASGLDGNAVRLSSFRGRVVVLDVWAAWCEGCEKDLPVLDEMAKRLAASGVEVVAVSLDADRRRLEPILASRRWRMTMLHDPTARVGELYRPSKMAAVFIIDAGGLIQHVMFGYSPSDLGVIEERAVSLASVTRAPGNP